MKVTADDIGIRNPQVTWPLKRASVVIRAALAVVIAAGCVLAVIDALTGHPGLMLVDACCAVLLAAVFGLNTWSNARLRNLAMARLGADSQPRVDWSHVYAMELDIYGRTFEHDGAPDYTRQELDAQMDGLVAPCERRNAEAGAFETLYKLRKDRLARRDMCDSGYHLLSVDDRCCKICGEVQGDSWAAGGIIR